MVRQYPYIVVLLFVGVLLTFSAGMANEGLSRLGFLLVVASGIALLLGIIRQRRGSGR
ncbi:MAG TPA: hypothetical protein VFO07_10395 [Roseiflexaceae bacterium]|nr:hypothetical protein [Roseiflexaceae bacterium]